MHSQLNQDTRHGGTNLARVAGISLGAADVLNGSLVIDNSDLADFTVHLKEDLTLTSVLAQRSNSKELEDQNLALFELNAELLTNFRLGKEIASRQHRQVSVLRNKLAVVLIDLGVHDVRGNVALSDGAGVLLDELLLDLGKVNGVQEETGALVELAASTKSIGAERLGESAVRLAHQTLKELQDRAGEVELASTGLDGVGVKAVGDHELGKITNNLGGGGDLDNVTKEIVGLLVSLLGLKPLRSKTKLGGLEHHVGELTTGDLVLVNLRVRTSKVSLERGVEETKLRPVGVEGADLVRVQARLEASALKRSKNSVDAGLGSHTRQAVSGSIDNVSAGLGASNHGGDTSTSRVVSVNVDREVRVLFTDGTDKKGGGVRLEDTGHILDAENVDVELDKLFDKVEVVLEVVLLLGVEHVTAEADGTLDNTTSLVNGLDTDLELVNVVQSIENTEDVNTVLLGLIDKVINGIVWKRRVGNTVGTTEKHLERNVGNKLAHAAETVPRILVEETHSNVKSSTAPALQTEKVGEGMAGLLGNVEQINSTDTGGKERLMGITPGSIHEKAALVLADSLGKALGTLFEEDVSPAFLGRLRGIDLGTVGSEDLGHDDLALEFGLSNLSLDGAAVDGNVSEVGKQLLASVLAAEQVKQLRSVIDECGPAVAFDECGMSEQTGKERDVGLDTTDAELDKSTEHLSACDFVGRTVAGTFDQHGVIEGGDDGTGKSVAAVESDACTTGGSVDLDLSSIGAELLSRVFGGDTALDSETASGDAVLGQAQLGKGGTSCDLNLSGHNINASDLFSNGVLDLDSRVDLDEVVAVLLVDKELGGTGIAVVDRLGQLDGVGKNGISGLYGKVLGRSNLNNLLVATLDGAVTLIQVDNVAMVVTEELDLNVLGLVKETLNKDGTVTKGRLGLGSSTLKALLEGLRLTNNTHATTTATVGGLDDDGEAILVGEALDLFVRANSIWGTGDNRNIGSNGKFSGRDLVTEGVDDIGRRADKLRTC